MRVERGEKECKKKKKESLVYYCRISQSTTFKNLQLSNRISKGY